MMAQGLFLRVVLLLFPCCAGTRRGQATRWSDEEWGSGSVTPTPSLLLNKAQVPAFETKPALG